MIVSVYGIKWDGADGLGLSDEMFLNISSEVFKDEENEDDRICAIEEYIADEISNISGFCHDSFNYEILKCVVCGGELKKEDTDTCDYTCKDCDCMQNENGIVFSDLPFYLANYGTETNIEIFQYFDDAKKESVDGKVYKATLSHTNVWFEKDLGWNYEDDAFLFIDEPLEVVM